MILRVRGINKVRAKGRVYLYHRKSGTRIPEEMTRDADALARFVADLEKRAPAAMPGTIGALVAAYRASPEFTGLAERTRSDYQKVFDYLAGLDALPLVGITPAFVFKLRDKAFAKKKRRFANYVVQVLRLVLGWGKPRGYVSANAAADVELVRRPRDARNVNRAWRDEEVDAVMAAAPAELRIPIALGLYAGLREADAIKITWTAYNGREIESRQGKTGEPIWIPAHRELRAVLDAAPRESPVIVTGARGRPFTQNGFQSRFFKLIRKLAAEGRVGKGLTFHGLRHSAGKRLADADCDTRDIMAVLGHKTEAMAAHYSKEADQRRRARGAILKLERKKPGKLQNRADGVAKPVPKRP